MLPAPLVAVEAITASSLPTRQRQNIRPRPTTAAMAAKTRNTVSMCALDDVGALSIVGFTRPRHGGIREPITKKPRDDPGALANPRLRSEARAGRAAAEFV